MLDRLGIAARGFAHDVMLYAFLLDADPSGCPLDEQARRRLDLRLGPAPEQHADITLEIYQRLPPPSTRRGLRQALRRRSSCRSPACSPAWSAPASASIPSNCARLSGLMESEIARLTAEIHALAGKPFNISSPQQLGRVLFEDLHLPAPVPLRQRQDHLHRRRRARRAGRRSRNRPQSPRIPPAHQAQGHLRRRPARPDRSRHRPPPHQLQPDRRRHRPPVVLQPQPAEHPHPHRTRPRNPRRLRPPRRLEAAGRRLFPNRAAPTCPHVAGSELLLEAFRNGEDIHTRTASEVLGVPPLHGHPGCPPRRQGRQFRHRLRHQCLRSGRAARHFPQGGREVYPGLFRPLRRRAPLASTPLLPRSARPV